MALLIMFSIFFYKINMLAMQVWRMCSKNSFSGRLWLKILADFLWHVVSQNFLQKTVQTRMLTSITHFWKLGLNFSKIILLAGLVFLKSRFSVCVFLQLLLMKWSVTWPGGKVISDLWYWHVGETSSNWGQSVHKNK